MTLQTDKQTQSDFPTRSRRPGFAVRGSTILLALALCLSGLALVVSLRQSEPPVFIGVSVKRLIEDRVATLANREIAPEAAGTEMATYMRAIEAAVGELSSGGNVVVLINEAVLGQNVPDFTDVVRASAEEHLRSRTVAADSSPRLDKLGDAAARLRHLETRMRASQMSEEAAP